MKLKEPEVTRKSSYPPERTKISVPRTEDAEFSHDLFVMEGRLLQTVSEKTPCLPDKTVIIQHDGAKPILEREMRRESKQWVQWKVGK